MLRQPHRMRAGQRQTQRELALRQPAIELMPQQPSHDRLRRNVEQEDPLPGNEHLVQPHLSIKLVVAAGQRRDERIVVAHRDLAAQRGDAGRADRHDERGAMRADLDARLAATDEYVLGVGGAGVHADLAADHQPLIGLAHDAEGGALGRILPHAIADRGTAAAEREEPLGARDHLAIGGGIGDLPGRDIALLYRGQQAERDHMAIGRRVGDVARAEERCGGKAATHADKVVRAARHEVGKWHAIVAEHGIGPGRIGMAIIPGDIFIDHRAGGGMGRDVVDQAFAHHPDTTPVAERLAVIGARSHHDRSLSPVV